MRGDKALYLGDPVDVDFDVLIVSVEEHHVETVLVFQLVLRVRPEHKILVRDAPRVGLLLQIPLVNNATSLAPHLEKVTADLAILMVDLHENRAERHALGIVAGVNDAVELLQLHLVHDLLKELLWLAVLVNEELQTSILNVTLNFSQEGLLNL